MNLFTRTVCAGYRDSVAFIGPAQSGKTNAMTAVALEVPGALFLPSTRGHIAVDTMIPRSRKGPVWLADPTGEGGFPTNLICSPLSGCRDWRTATASAGELIHASPRDAHNTGAAWDKKAAEWLKYAMHAAAWEPGATLLDVKQWAADPGSWHVPVRILAACPRATDRWAAELAAMCRTASADAEYGQFVSFSAAGALDWLSDPAVQAIAGGPPGEDGELSPEEFLLKCGSLYLVAGDKPHNPVSPYYAWLLSYIFNAGKRIAAALPGRILRPPCTIMLDEPLASCKTRLDKMIIEAAGWGFPFYAGFQSYSQLAEGWGEQAAKTISNNLTWQCYLGGTQEPEHLERMSAMGLDEDTEDRRTRIRGTRRTFTPGRLNLLQQGEVFVKARACRGFIGRIPHASEHPLYEAAGPGTWPVEASRPARASQPAVTAAPVRAMVPDRMLRRIPVPVRTRPAYPALPARLAIDPPRREPVPVLTGTGPHQEDASWPASA